MANGLVIWVTRVRKAFGGVVSRMSPGFLVVRLALGCVGVGIAPGCVDIRVVPYHLNIIVTLQCGGSPSLVWG